MAAQRPSKDAISKDEAERGMAAMSKKFIDMGAQVYVEAEKVKESNKALYVRDPPLPYREEPADASAPSG